MVRMRAEYDSNGVNGSFVTVNSNSSEDRTLRIALAMSREAGIKNFANVFPDTSKHDWMAYNPFTIEIRNLIVELTRFFIFILRNLIRIFSGGGS